MLIIINLILTIIININYGCSMIICLCNNISEKEIEDAIERGSTKITDVYNALGCKPQCGSCMDFIKDKILVKSNNIEIA